MQMKIFITGKQNQGYEEQWFRSILEGFGHVCVNTWQKRARQQPYIKDLWEKRKEWAEEDSKLIYKADTLLIMPTPLHVSSVEDHRSAHLTLAQVYEKHVFHVGDDYFSDWLFLGQTKFLPEFVYPGIHRDLFINAWTEFDTEFVKWVQT